MLIISVVLSTFFLIAANAAIFRSKGHTMEVLFSGLVVLVTGSCFGAAFFISIALQIIGVSVALVFWRATVWRPSGFLVTSIVITLLAYSLSVIAGLQRVQLNNQLREEFPYESMEERLQNPPASEPKSDTLYLAKLEEFIGDPNSKAWMRNQMLSDLHKEQIQTFINSPGFGMMRMGPILPSRHYIKGDLSAPLPQTEPPTTFPSAGDKPSAKMALVEEPNTDLHLKGLVDFLNPKGFGHFKDRQHVAGFQPHQFSERPKVNEPWELRRIELVGLLLHKEPVVYVSDNLPRMDELRGAPTRPLDAFESAGLEQIRSGKDLLVADTAEGSRMLGSIRSVKQCADCHATKRGELLGAFSYTLKRAKK